MQLKTYLRETSYFSKSKNRNIKGTESMIELKCDVCGTVHSRTSKHFNKMKKSFVEFNQDYCNKCWIPILNNRPVRIENMRRGLEKAYNDRPELRQKMSAIVTGRNAGDNNPMKKQAVRDKVSATRTALLADPKIRDKFKKKTLDAWARGAYDNADKNGWANWHNYLHSNGTTYMVQGNYELAFIKYLDTNNLKFECHKGKIPYIGDDNNIHHYFPDFFVYEWNCWVDPKSHYWHKKQRRKFELLTNQYNEFEIRVLTEDKLKELGIKLCPQRKYQK